MNQTSIMGTKPRCPGCGTDLESDSLNPNGIFRCYRFFKNTCPLYFSCYTTDLIMNPGPQDLLTWSITLDNFQLFLNFPTNKMTIMVRADSYASFIEAFQSPIPNIKSWYPVDLKEKIKTWLTFS